MKKVILLVAVLSTMAAHAQKRKPSKPAGNSKPNYSVLSANDSTSTDTVPKVRNVYLSIGPGYSAGIASYGLEFGYFNSKTWLGGSISTSVDSTGKRSTYIGPKFYYLIDNLTKKIDFYAYTGIYVEVSKPHPLELESGISVVFNLSSAYALQFNVSAPLYEHVAEVDPAVGLSFNCYF